MKLSRGAAGAAALLLLSACAAPPSPTPSPARHTSPPTASASLPVAARATPTETSRPVTLAVEQAPVPGPFGTVVTDGASIAWSSGEIDGVTTPDLLRWKVGSSKVELLFKNPRRNAGISLPAIDGDRVAFTESAADNELTIHWNFLYLASPGAKPVKLASAVRPVDSPGVVPQPTISGDRLVYSLQTISGASATSELISVDLRTMKQTILAKSDFDEVEYWYPSLDGDQLVYGTVEYANDAVNGERHVYVQDLGTPGSAPRRLDSDGEASQPAIHGDTVIWKTAPPDFNANNWGQLVRHSLSTGRTQPLDYLGESTGYFLVMPHIGPRFVAAEPSDWTRLAVYDLETGREITVAEADPKGNAGFMRPSLGGGIFAWVAATDFTGQKSELHFVRLPPP